MVRSRERRPIVTAQPAFRSLLNLNERPMDLVFIESEASS